MKLHFFSVVSEDGPLLREDLPGRQLSCLRLFSRPDRTGGSADPDVRRWRATRRAASGGGCPARTRGDRRASPSPANLPPSRVGPREHAATAAYVAGPSG